MGWRRPYCVKKCREVSSRRWGIRALLLSGLVLSMACSPDFDDVAMVKDLRFLGIKADPPEQVLWRDAISIPPSVGAWLLGAMKGGAGLDALCGPEASPPPATIPGIAPIRISALLADPRIPEAEQGTRKVRWEIWACGASKGSCAASDGYRVKIAARESPLSQVGFTFVPDGELFRRALCEDAYKGFGGLPILVELRVFDVEGDRWIYGAKRVVYTFWLPYSPVPAAQRANTNPELQEVRITVQDADEKEVRTLDLATLGSGPVLLREDESLKIEPVLTEASKEDFVQVSAGDGKQGLGSLQVLELEECDKGETRSKEAAVTCGTFFSWQFYATGGALSHATTGGMPPLFVENKKVKDVSSTWSPPIAGEGTLLPGEETRLWLVGDDGRGGVVWRTWTAKVKDVP